MMDIVIENKMDAKYWVNYFNNRCKTYNFHILKLKDIKNIELFDDAVCELFDDIFDDMQYEKDSEIPMSTPIIQAANRLDSVRNNTINFYTQYKQLMNF